MAFVGVPCRSSADVELKRPIRLFVEKTYGSATLDAVSASIEKLNDLRRGTIQRLRDRTLSAAHQIAKIILKSSRGTKVRNGETSSVEQHHKSFDLWSKRLNTTLTWSTKTTLVKRTNESPDVWNSAFAMIKKTIEKLFLVSFPSVSSHLDFLSDRRKEKSFPAPQMMLKKTRIQKKHQHFIAEFMRHDSH
ncbi:hypothetical protein T265_05830 [Opisthorchis viverrini]|uniref:Uncharacterized protein n=1 Tax=Opisthorchis viverrini TaxID=6198 RepID=A0A074ZMT0_OPIVI|nr:hypothetical protein T265_05830 [Opisthorchis viverrini]KER27072.1 hypothetical protein T265_05830 [Opisthorchis viverrini]